MRYRRMTMEVESPEQLGYDSIRCNLAESSVADLTLKELDLDLDGVVLKYGDHMGNPELREVLAADALGLRPQDVLVTAGAAMALFVVATTLLDREDHLVVARPNYASNLETPRAIGCDISYLDLAFDEDWRVDPDRLGSMMKTNTKLVSLTSPHNPTGTIIDHRALAGVVAMVERHGAWLLVDETYREMAYGEPPPPAVSLGPRVIGVGSVSKAYGLPGIRTGWLTCRDPELMETFLAAKEQICLTGSMVDEEIASRVLAARHRWLPQSRTRIRRGFETVQTWMVEHPEMEWIEPSGGVVCFPRIADEVNVDLDGFYRRLLDEHGTMVGPGHWFEQPRRYMRIGFGWPSPEELSEGLAAVASALASSAP